MQDELDENLQLLFQEQSRNLPEEPFLGNMLKLIHKRQSRRVFKQRMVLVLGFACCAVLSPILIKGSIVLSSHLNLIIEAAGGFLDKPAGIITAVLCCILLLFIFKRRLISALA
jgi:hypothetical protein